MACGSTAMGGGTFGSGGTGGVGLASGCVHWGGCCGSGMRDGATGASGAARGTTDTATDEGVDDGSTGWAVGRGAMSVRGDAEELVGRGGTRRASWMSHAAAASAATPTSAASNLRIGSRGYQMGAGIPDPGA